MTAHAALLFVLLFAQCGFAQKSFLGTTTAKVSLDGASVSSDLALIPVHAGDVITSANVRAAIQALYDTGRYDYVEVAAESTANGTNLTFRVRPYRFFSTFRVEPNDLLPTALSSNVRLPIGEKFSKTQIDRVVEQTQNLLENEGYFNATIKPEVHFADQSPLATVVLSVTSKARARFSSVGVELQTDTFSQKELLEALGLKSGQEFSTEKLDSGIAKIRSKFTDLGFLNSHIEPVRHYDEKTNTIALTISVDPGQFALVEVRGYNIPKKKLHTTIPIFEEGTVDPDLVEEGRVRIHQLLQQDGYYDATVTSEIVQAPLDKAVQINYSVEKGDQHRVSAIHIEGTKFFTMDEVRSHVKSRADVFSPDLLSQDVQAIRTIYKNAGFDGTSVDSHFTDTDHVLDIVISIQEGTRYTIDTIYFTGNHGATDSELRAKAGLKAGEIYIPAAIEKARNDLTSLYYAKGYPDVSIVQNVGRSANQPGVAVTFNIIEGGYYKIGKVLVAGNTLTKEKIVRRNSDLFPNIPYNPEVILQTQQKLYATGLFNRVDIVTLPESLTGIRNVLIQVEDAKPILVTYGLGYQDVEGPRATVEVSQTNLFGLDRSVTLRLLGSKNDQLFRTTLREPRLFNHDLEGELSAYVEHTHQPQFDANRVDSSLQVLKRLAPSENLLFLAGYQKINLLDILVNPLADQFPDERGIVHIARIGTTLVHDRRNDPINPRNGTFQTTTIQLADHAFGSGVNFTSFFDQYIRYKPVGPGVIAGSLRFGWKHPFAGTTELPITERYFAGGSTTLRGFGLYEAGPIGGGDAMTIGNLEYRFPISGLHLSNLGGALFYDTGNVFTSLSEFRFQDFTHSTGVGLRYETPLGPVRVDFGFNLHPEERADGSIPKVFHTFFTLGHTF